jgi:hypothetical protein
MKRQGFISASPKTRSISPMHESAMRVSVNEHVRRHSQREQLQIQALPATSSVIFILESQTLEFLFLFSSTQADGKFRLKSFDLLACAVANALNGSYSPFLSLLITPTSLWLIYSASHSSWLAFSGRMYSRLRCHFCYL